MATQVQNAVRKEGGHNLGSDVRGPEERETYWQLIALVEIAEVQDDLDSPYVSCRVVQGLLILY